LLINNFKEYKEGRERGLARGGTEARKAEMDKRGHGALRAAAPPQERVRG